MRVRPDGLPRAAAGGGGARPAPAARYGNLLFALCDAVAHTIRPPLERIDCGLPRRGRRAPKRTPSGDRTRALASRGPGRCRAECDAKGNCNIIQKYKVYKCARDCEREITLRSIMLSSDSPRPPRAVRSTRARSERSAPRARGGAVSRQRFRRVFSFCEILSMLLSRDY
jgi:hypothetical protein